MSCIPIKSGRTGKNVNFITVFTSEALRKKKKKGNKATSS